MKINAFILAQRFVGAAEITGDEDNPLILTMLQFAAGEGWNKKEWPEHDEVPWCSGFVNFVCKLLRLPRSKDLRARSWLKVGWPIDLIDAKPMYDVVILKRGGDNRGPDVIDAPGHVGFYAGVEDSKVLVLGGNQSNEVNVSRYPKSKILGVRRLYNEAA